MNFSCYLRQANGVNDGDTVFVRCVSVCLCVCVSVRSGPVNNSSKTVKAGYWTKYFILWALRQQKSGWVAQSSLKRKLYLDWIPDLAPCNSGKAPPVERCWCGLLANGQWSYWSSWTRCSVSCGEGTRRRTRRCDNPAPSNDGRPCVGTDADTKTCILRDCPSKKMSLFTAWLALIIWLFLGSCLIKLSEKVFE